MPVTRTELGLPENWLWIENWLNDFEDGVPIEKEEYTAINLKNQEKNSKNQTFEKINTKMLVFMDFFGKTNSQKNTA